MRPSLARFRAPNAIRRFLLATASAVAWPSVLVIVVAGLTFHAIEVFAESAPYIPPCEVHDAGACNGASINQACEGPAQTTGNACRPLTCAEGGAYPATGRALACVPIRACAGPDFAGCDGKEVDASCDPTYGSNGHCERMPCDVLSGNMYVESSRLGCVPTPVSQDARTGNQDANTPAPSAAPIIVPSSDGGCSTSVRSTTSAALPLLGIAAVWLLRRRRAVRGRE